MSTSPSTPGPPTEPAEPGGALPAAQPERRPGTRRRRVRWFVRILLGVPLLACLTLAMLMRSPLVERSLRAMVLQQTGCRIEASRAVIGVDGRLIVDDLRIIAPGLAGPEAEVLSAKRAEVDLDWSGALGGTVVPVALRLYQPRFLLSQSMDDNALNLAAISPPISPSGTAAPTIPRLDVIDGSIVFAEHSARQSVFRTLNTIHVAGALTPADIARPVYSIRFQEIGRTPSPMADRTDGPGTRSTHRGMILDGRIDLAKDEISIRLLNLPLEAWPPEAVPTSVRDLWRRLNIQGQVAQTTFSYSPTEGVRTEIVLADVALSALIPATGEDQNADGYLSLSAVNGTITFTGEGLSADLVGRIEDQNAQSHVVLQTQGTDLNSALRCEITAKGLSVSKNPGFLPYVPDTVREYLGFFGGPTAEVDARVIVQRGEPVNGEAAPVEVPEGDLAFRNGAAAFHKFPYPFTEMSGIVKFDDEHIEIIQARGLGPTGARLAATAWIGPLTDDALAKVNIQVSGAPIDQYLIDAMPESKERILHVLFNQAEHSQLLDSGLVTTPGKRSDDLSARSRLAQELAEAERGADPAAAAALRGRIDVLDRAIGAPNFAFGGIADIDVTVLRPRGRKTKWKTDIAVSFERAGLVPEPFPFPILARDVRLEISDERAVLTSGAFAGLRGGRADLTAEVVLEIDDQPVLRPTIHIAASGVPVDDLLIHAVPDDADRPGAGAVFDGAAAGDPPFSAKRLLSSLEIRGLADCTADITSGPTIDPADPDPTEFDVAVTFDGLSASSRAAAQSGASPLCVLGGLTGTIRVTQDFVRIPGLEGRFVSADPSTGEDRECGTLHLNLSAAVDIQTDRSEPRPPEPGPSGAASLVVSIDDFDASTPVDQIVSLFSPDAGRTIADIRETARPEGRLDALVEVSQPERPWGTPADQSLTVTVSNIRSLAADALGGRAAIHDASGRTLFRTGDNASGSSLEFRDVRARIGMNGEPAGAIVLDGAVGLRVDTQPDQARGQPNVVAAPESDLFVGPARFSAALTDGRFESQFVAGLLSRFAGEQTLEAFRALKPYGSFDASATVLGQDEGTPLRVEAVLWPRSFGFESDGSRVALPSLSGRITLNAQTRPPTSRTEPPISDEPSAVYGVIDNLRFVTDLWSLSADGSWQYSTPAGGTIHARMSAESRGLPPDLRALLPGTVQRALDDLELSVEGPIRLSPSELHVRSSPTPEGGNAVATDFEGEITFESASFEAGLSVTECDGRVMIRSRNPDGVTRAEAPNGSALEVRFFGDRLRVAGLSLTDLEALIVSGGDPPGQTTPAPIEVPYVSARTHAGRVWATASIRPSSADSGAPFDYSVDALLSGASLAGMLEELAGDDEESLAAAARAAKKAPKPGGADQTVPLDRTTPDPTRGLVDARVSIAGRSGDDASRYGRGAVRIAGGELIRLPLVFPLVQLSNMVLPSDDRFDYLQSTFHLTGDIAHFDQVAVLAESVSLLGSGTITIPGLRVDMRFNSRSNSRLPVFSDLMEAVRNEFVTTRVTGTVQSPDVRSETLTSTRRFLDSLFNPGDARVGARPISNDQAARVARLHAADSSIRAQRAVTPLIPRTRPESRAGDEP